VTDEAILEAQARRAMAEGNFVCPEGAATFAAAQQLSEQGWIKAEEEVVRPHTAAGLKYS
jgi:threonine synthase